MKILRANIERYLEEQPLARERHNKDRAIVNVLVMDPKFVPLQLLIQKGELTKNELTKFVQDYNSTDRAWRKILEERPELRGKDYENKDELERVTQEELGYNVPPTTP